MKAITPTYPTLTNKRVFYNPKKYLKLLRENTNDIEQVRIILPKLGEKGFGGIEVETKNIYGNI